MAALATRTTPPLREAHTLLHFDKSSQISSFKLHGFCDASEYAYAAIVYMYLHIIRLLGEGKVSQVSSKTKVTPIKRLTIPHLELCEAYLLAVCEWTLGAWRELTDHTLTHPISSICFYLIVLGCLIIWVVWLLVFCMCFGSEGLFSLSSSS